uniref:Uncharacterized protein n=1 Tax=Pavo cristatus TaxID=9049 RepID=A0A8C9FPE9_PAVCR
IKTTNNSLVSFLKDCSCILRTPVESIRPEKQSRSSRKGLMKFGTSCLIEKERGEKKKEKTPTRHASVYHLPPQKRLTFELHSISLSPNTHKVWSNKREMHLNRKLVGFSAGLA